ncbi:MAG: GTP-binding protein [Prochlorotrichaceae cyanobacterium]
MHTLDRAELEDWLQTWIQDYRNRPASLQAKLQDELLTLEGIQQRLKYPILTVATFGLVSRGKSAVCNALLGEKRLATGAAHGVTRWPRSLRWLDASGFGVDLVDTPGLDEVAGQDRQTMTEAIVAEADLLIFVVNATLTELEVASLQTLIAEKPLLLVLNKIDLYPEAEQGAILAALQQQLMEILSSKAILPSKLPPLIAVAAEPKPQPIQVEWPDGQITDSWETPSPLIAPLEEAIRHHLQSQGIPAFFKRQQQQAEQSLKTIAAKTLVFYQADRDRLQRQFLQGRVLWVALSPWVLTDVLGAFLVDLLFIRNLSKVYHWPITSHALPPLWKTILQNLLLLAIGEWSSRVFTPADLSLLGVGGPFTLLGGILLQGMWAGYGSSRIGDAAQRYLASSYGARSSPPRSELIQEFQD